MCKIQQQWGLLQVQLVPTTEPFCMHLHFNLYLGVTCCRTPHGRDWVSTFPEWAEVRVTCTQAVCAYIVRQKLQDAAQPGVVRCDARLRGVLGEAAVQMGSVAERLAPHLSPAPPIELTFSIKCACRLPAAAVALGNPAHPSVRPRSTDHECDQLGRSSTMFHIMHTTLRPPVRRPAGPSPSTPDCYDIDIEVPLPPASVAAPALLTKLDPAHEVEPVRCSLCHTQPIPTSGLTHMTVA